MLTFLTELEATGGPAESLYIPSGLPLQDVGNLLEKALDPTTVPPELAELAAASKTGAVIFGSSSQTRLIVPPFPIREEYFARGYVVEPLSSLLKSNFRVALILIRLGAYAIGLSEGEILPPLLDIPEPRQAVLEKAVRRVWSSSVIEWRDDEVLV